MKNRSGFISLFMLNCFLLAAMLTITSALHLQKMLKAADHLKTANQQQKFRKLLLQQAEEMLEEGLTEDEKELQGVTASFDFSENPGIIVWENKKMIITIHEEGKYVESYSIEEEWQ